MSIYDKSSLVLIPSGTKTGKVYSQKPVSGDGDFTFSRSTAATRVNADGNIEKETQNLLLQSNSFNTTWTNTNSTETSGQSGYDGSSDAWLLQSTINGVAYLRQSYSSSGVQTFSFYAKAGNVNFVQAYVTGADSSHYFNLSAGTAETPTGGGKITSKITSVGSGWYRCECIHQGSASGANIYIRDAVGGTASIGDNIYIQDAQLEQGMVARDYIETTTAAVEGGITDNVPRLDYTDSSCPALLLEPQRTNSYTNSEYFDDWLSNRLDRTANNIISPEGVQNAYKMAQQSGFTTAPNINKGGVAAGTYTISIFAKKGSWNYLAISFQGVSYFNLETGSKGTINSNHTATIEDYGNGWYRCAITRTTTTTQTPAFYFAESDNTLTTPDTQGYMYTFGAQLEASASYATSYIPTYGTSVTRNADSCLATSVSDVIGQTQGTLFFECTNKALVNQARYFLLSDGGFNNRIDIYQVNENNLGLYVATSGAAQVSVTNVTLPSSGSFKFAVAYANNDYVWYLNGTQIGTDTSASVPTLTNALFALNAAGGTLGGSGNSPFKQALLFKTRLTNTELAALTTI